MSGRTSSETVKAMELVKGGMSPYEAAKTVKIALSTIYRSALYKAWKAAQQPKENQHDQA